MTARYSIAILAYPSEYRRTHVGELVQTANELASGRWSLRQSRSLLVEGLRTRARLSSNGSTAQVWGNGIATALALTSLLWVAFPLADLSSGQGDPTIIWVYPRWIFLVQGLVTLAALTVSTRWPTAMTITAVNAVSAIGVLQNGPATVHLSTLTYALATSALGWWLATRTDGRRALSPKTTLVLLGAIVGMSMVAGLQAVGVVVVLTLFGAVLLGLALVTVDPRPLIVGTTYFALTTITSMFSVLPGESVADGVVMVVSVAVLATAIQLSRFGTRRLLVT